MRSAHLLLASLVGLAACDPDPPPPEPPCTGSGITNVRLHTRLTGQILGSRPANLAWVAFQDGECAWKRVDGVAGEYSYEITNAQYGVAVACDEPGGEVGLRMTFATVDEVLDLYEACARRLGGDLSELPQIDVFVSSEEPVAYQFWIDRATGIYGLGAGTPIEHHFHAEAGLYDLVVRGRFGKAGNASEERLNVVRGLDPAQNPFIELDPAAAEGWIPQGSPATVTMPASAGAASLSVDYLTGRGTPVDLADAASSSLEYPTFPAALAAAGDAYRARAIVGTGPEVSVVERFSVQPVEGELLVPPRFATAPVISRDEVDAVAFDVQPVEGADLYGLETGHLGDPGFVRLTFSTDWLHRAGGKPTVRRPPASEGFLDRWGWNLDGSWTASARGSEGGWEAWERLEAIGRREGAPAELDGVSFWKTTIPAKRP